MQVATASRVDSRLTNRAQQQQQHYSSADCKGCESCKQLVITEPGNTCVATADCRAELQSHNGGAQENADIYRENRQIEERENPI